MVTIKILVTNYQLILYRRNQPHGVHKSCAAPVAPTHTPIYNRRGMTIRKRIIEPLPGRWAWKWLFFFFACVYPNSEITFKSPTNIGA